MNKNQYCSISWSRWISSVEFNSQVQKKSLNNNKHLQDIISSGVCFPEDISHTPSHLSSIRLQSHTHWLTSFRHRRTELELLKMTIHPLHENKVYLSVCLRAARGALAFSMSIINCNSVKAVTDWRCWAVLFCQRAVAQPLFMLTCLLSQVWSPVQKMRDDWGGWFRLRFCSMAVFIKTDGQ